MKTIEIDIEYIAEIYKVLPSLSYSSGYQHGERFVMYMKKKLSLVKEELATEAQLCVPEEVQFIADFSESKPCWKPYNFNFLIKAYEC